MVQINAGIVYTYRIYDVALVRDDIFWHIFRTFCGTHFWHTNVMYAWHTSVMFVTTFLHISAWRGGSTGSIYRNNCICKYGIYGFKLQDSNYRITHQIFFKKSLGFDNLLGHMIFNFF